MSRTTSTEPREVRTIQTPLLVVGSGIAGLSAALGHGNSLVLSKTALGDGSSGWAQGGIAAAMGNDDDPSVHSADTLRVGVGLENSDIVSLVTNEAPDRIRWLVDLGAEFDRDSRGDLALGREAGHTRHRIVHADGDATGAEVMRALTSAVRKRADIETLVGVTALDLLTCGNDVVGVLAIDGAGEFVAIRANSVVLATGGIGRVYRHTTNPHEVAADGIGMAHRAGVAIRDPEFVQFHPTALESEIDPMPLLTEALRGEGALLVDADGHRFMVDVHDDAELAPRDVIARQVWWHRQRGPVYLDARMIGSDFPTRFPTVWTITQRAGLDPRTDLLPISAAQHFHMGGVATDDLGRTSVPGLFACGEASSTGLHGANRLASNSLLEGLVFGARVADEIASNPRDLPLPDLVDAPEAAFDVDVDRLQHSDRHIDELRSLMWENVGIVRDDAGLRQACARIDALEPDLATHPTGRNLAAAARLIAQSALARTESRGSHHRSDHLATSTFASHTIVRSEPVPTRPLIASEKAPRYSA